MNDNYEVEETLAKLYFYLKLSILDDDYSFCKKEYMEILRIVDKWIIVYSNEKSIGDIDEESILKAQDIFYKIPFKNYKGYYYFEYIDAYLDKIKYFKKNNKKQ